MSRAKRRQLGIGEWVGEWPIFMLRGEWATIGDWRQCKRPEIGELVIAVLSLDRASPYGAQPSRLEILGSGQQSRIGKYASAAERRALLNGRGGR